MGFIGMAFFSIALIAGVVSGLIFTILVRLVSPKKSEEAEFSFTASFVSWTLTFTFIFLLVAFYILKSAFG